MTTLLFTNLVTLFLLWRKNEQWAEMKNEQAERDLEAGRSATFYV